MHQQEKKGIEMLGQNGGNSQCLLLILPPCKLSVSERQNDFWRAQGGAVTKSKKNESKMSLALLGL